MEKIFYKSKTIQGIALAVIGFLWGVWTGESEVSKSMVAAGLGWAGFGLRDAIKK